MSRLAGECIYPAAIYIPDSPRSPASRLLQGTAFTQYGLYQSPVWRRLGFSCRKIKSTATATATATATVDFDLDTGSEPACWRMHLSSRHLHTRLTAFASKPAPTGVCVHPVRPALKSRFAVSGLAWKDQNQKRSRDAERLVRHYHAERGTDRTTPRTPCGTGFSREEACLGTISVRSVSDDAVPAEAGPTRTTACS